ncbi:MAG: T9SS C-terminal target domain-containing protein [Bacteroidales bacterium]|nr:T9SS C-terminal target domain-containing protein [Bacteroidales bacterium]
MNFSSLLKRSALAAVLLAIAALPMSSGVKREVRSVWMATVWALDWPSSTRSTTAQKNEMVKYLDVLQKNNFNAVYFQVRTMSDAFYKSSYEPWSSYLTGTRGKDPGWDPLAFVVEECHKRGMECHAWVNPYRFSTGSNWSTAQDQALKSAGMLLAYTKSDGKTTTILNPGLESVRKRIVDVCKEIISNYDVDGLVFDDYFYPEGIPVTSSAGDYDLWQKSGASMTFGDWRRNNVNQMVADVYKMVQQQKPYVRFGISPAGAACTSAAVAAKHGIDRCPVASDWQYDGIFSDPVAWLEAGTIDYISPQLYWKTNHKTNPFGPMTKWWSYVAKHFGRHHYASHSISFLNSSNTTSDWEEIGKQVQFSRDYTENEAPGAVFYSAAYVTGKKQSGFGEWLQVNKFQNKALTPAIDWKKSDLEKVQVSALSKRATVLSWAGVDNVRYSVYAVPESVNVETLDSNIPAEYLLGVSYKTTYTMPDDKKSGYNYAVCVLDRYGNEYEPVYYGQSGVESIGENSGLTADYADGELRLSAVVDEVFVYNEAGALVANSRNCNRLALSVQAGMYIVRMIGNGGVSTEKIIVK